MGGVYGIIASKVDVPLLLRTKENWMEKSQNMLAWLSSWCSTAAPYKRKLDDEKSKHAGLAKQNGFDPAFLHRI
jgi:hypothetical protein